MKNLNFKPHLLLILTIGLVVLGSLFELETSKRLVTSVLSLPVKSRPCQSAHQRSPMSKRHLKSMNNRYTRAKRAAARLRSQWQYFTDTFGIKKNKTKKTVTWPFFFQRKGRGGDELKSFDETEMMTSELEEASAHQNQDEDDKASGETLGLWKLFFLSLLSKNSPTPIYLMKLKLKSCWNLEIIDVT